MPEDIKIRRYWKSYLVGQCHQIIYYLTGHRFHNQETKTGNQTWKYPLDFLAAWPGSKKISVKNVLTFQGENKNNSKEYVLKLLVYRNSGNLLENLDNL